MIEASDRQCIKSEVTVPSSKCNIVADSDITAATLSKHYRSDCTVINDTESIVSSYLPRL